MCSVRFTISTQYRQDGYHEEVEARIAASRKLGRDKDVKGVSSSPRKNVLPNMHDLAHAHGGLATRQAIGLGTGQPARIRMRRRGDS